MTKQITGVIVTIIFNDGDYVTEAIDNHDDFIDDLQSNIKLHSGCRHNVIDAMRFLINFGSKAISGVNPKNYESEITTHFGDTRNVNSMIRGSYNYKRGKFMTFQDEMALDD